MARAVPHSGDTSAVVPPVPIPNTAVKRCSPDGSTAIGRARVGRRQNPATRSSGGAFLCWGVHVAPAGKDDPQGLRDQRRMTVGQHPSVWPESKAQLDPIF